MARERDRHGMPTAHGSSVGGRRPAHGAQPSPTLLRAMRVAVPVPVMGSDRDDLGDRRVRGAVGWTRATAVGPSVLRRAPAPRPGPSPLLYPLRFSRDCCVHTNRTGPDRTRPPPAIDRVQYVLLPQRRGIIMAKTWSTKYITPPAPVLPWPWVKSFRHYVHMAPLTAGTGVRRRSGAAVRAAV
jgi:hypothetical protein